MREIKASVRPERVRAVVVALHDAGVSHTWMMLRVFVSEVDRALKIRSRSEGREALV